jgi:hypothetical protein
MTRTYTMSGGQVVVSSNLATPTNKRPCIEQGLFVLSFLEFGAFSRA